MASIAEIPSDQAHIELERAGKLPSGLLPPDIYDSWLRCIALGLDARRPPATEIADSTRLRSQQQYHALVRGLALAEMHTLHQQIAGTNFMIAFATPEGMLLDIVADKSFSDTPEAASILPGSIWSEKRCGTNGLGTVAFLKRSVTVQGSEHYFQRYRKLTCTASPVFAPDGTLAGILDASTDCVSRQTHTEALVAMAATQIENSLFREQHRGKILVALHNRGEYLHTLSAGLLAIDSDGMVLAANMAARVLLHGLPAMPGSKFNDIFRTRFASFIDDGRKNERLRLLDGVGSSFIATVEIPRIMTQGQASSRPKPEAHEPVATAFVAADPVVANIVRQTETAARRKMPILVRGETGTGKEQLARHAHIASRRTGAFVAVNCTALPESLVEAELFGYSDGAFTGARKGGSRGLFQEADGGTLFLDEIGDMAVTLQAVLLRFLDDWIVRPIGGTKRQVDVLLVSATNANLDESIARGRFRSDLMFRLNTLEVTLPPLRERTDFDALCRHLLAAIDPSRMLSAGAIQRLATMQWAGNARELRNVLSRLTLNAAEGLIDEVAVETVIGGRAISRPTGSLHDQQRARIMQAYGETGNNISETARRLGVSRNTIYRALGQPETRMPSQGA